MNYFFTALHTKDMKRLVILLLTVFTIGAVTVCGCDDNKKNNDSFGKINTENVQIRTSDENDENQKDICPDMDEHDGKCPIPRRPHRGHHKRLPRPKSAYRKQN